MKPLISRLALLLFPLWLPACQSADTTPELPADRIVFDVFGINYAWGFACGGWYIDAGGAVHHYDCRGLGDTISQREWHGRERELLKRRFQMLDSVICHVDTTELRSMRALISVAAKTPPSTERQTAFDAGGVSFVGYLYNSTDSTVTEVLLATSGDFTREPSSSAANHLVKWLKAKCRCQDAPPIR